MLEGAQKYVISIASILWTSAAQLALDMGFGAAFTVEMGSKLGGYGLRRPKMETIPKEREGKNKR